MTFLRAGAVPEASGEWDDCRAQSVRLLMHHGAASEPLTVGLVQAAMGTLYENVVRLEDVDLIKARDIVFVWSGRDSDLYEIGVEEM